MVKVQNKTRRSAEAVQKSPKFKKAFNPFEVFLNKVKIRFLNKKTKHDGVSLSKAFRKTETTDYKLRNRRVNGNRPVDISIPCSILNSKKKSLLFDEHIWTYHQQTSKDDYLKGLEKLQSSNNQNVLGSPKKQNTSIYKLTDQFEYKEVLLIVPNCNNKIDDQIQLPMENNILQSFEKNLEKINLSFDDRHMTDISVSDLTLSMNNGITTVSVHDVILKNVEEPEKNMSYFRKKVQISKTNLINRSIMGYSETESLNEDFKEIKLLDKARGESQSMYGLPENYEQLRELLQDKPSHDQSVIIERMIQCNHLSLQKENMIEVSSLFEYLLRHLSDICCDLKDCKKCFDVFTCLTPQFFDLAMLNPERAHISLLDVIQEKQTEYRKDTSRFPGIDVILYLNLSYQLFTEKELQLLTPNLVFMEQMLTTCQVKTRADVAYGLFLVTLIAQYTSLSKGYSPACVMFLNGILRIAIPKNSKQFPSSNKFSCSLVLTEPVDSMDNDKLDIKDLTDAKDFDQSFRGKVINVSLGLLIYFHSCCESLPSCFEIFERTLVSLKQLPVMYYPKELNETISKFIHDLEQSNKNRILKFIIMDTELDKTI
ncbi:PREDICTED: uncharacterized protein LOC108568765 isoform X2 [Nicrophorus vespilloides]|uniref:Uncharacterized protein LOC108568765 isoform X2 n=1 Tax=Nicrophorus vespilloides TaxID=110193 RepID=A0ABM1NFD4_NICVS|nr:PREDICTED: uncharacterized protein LOC108568765 isoform X2 [Nicrophorus vespilloides]